MDSKRPVRVLSPGVWRLLNGKPGAVNHGVSLPMGVMGDCPAHDKLVRRRQTDDQFYHWHFGALRLSSASGTSWSMTRFIE